MPSDAPDPAAEVAPGIRRLGTTIVNWYLVEDGGRLMAVDSGLTGTWNPLTGELGPRLMPKQFDVSYAGCIESLERLEPLQAEIVLPGHGDPWRGSPADAAGKARTGVTVER